MRTSQENRLNMDNNVISIFDDKDNALIIATKLQLKDSINRFKTGVGNIKTTIINKESEISGITKSKHVLRNNLIHISAITAAALSAYAHKNKNLELKSEISFSQNRLNKLTDILLIEKANMILSKANFYALTLFEYDIDASELITLGITLEDFENNYNTPTLAIERAKYYTELLEEQFTTTNDILTNEIDPLMFVLSDEHPKFYSLYINARNIYDRRGKSRKQLIEEGIGIVSLNVTATIDASPLEGAVVDMIANNTVVASVDVDENAEAYFEEVPAGKYTFRVSQETYITKQTAEISVSPGDELLFDISLDADIS